MEGVELMYLKHKITQDFLDATRARGDDLSIGITTSTGTTNITGVGTTSFVFEENQNFIQIPDAVIGIERVFKLDNRAISTNMFNINYQLFFRIIIFFRKIAFMIGPSFYVAFTSIR